ncbi:hypothetical protein KY334_06530 [Candidatus Woesearchaeota archaeon]|nr:hypothetical protein [Candidatus Woesearchaeota archaeon]
MAARDRYCVFVDAKFKEGNIEINISQLKVRMSENNEPYSYMRGNIDERVDGMEVLESASLEGLTQIINENKLKEGDFKKHDMTHYISRIKAMIDIKTIKYN